MRFREISRPKNIKTLAIISLVGTFYCQGALADIHCDNIERYENIGMPTPIDNPYEEAGCMASSLASFVKNTELNQLQGQHNQGKNARANATVSNSPRIAAIVLPFAIDGNSGGTQGHQLSLYVTAQDFDGRRGQTVNATGFDFDGRTFVLGLDYQWSDSLFLGANFSVNDINSDFDFVGVMSGGSSDIESRTWAVNVAKYWGDNWAWQNQLSIASQDIDTTRNNFGDQFSAQTSADNHAIMSEVVYTKTFEGWRLTPSVGITYLSGEIDGYQEVVETGFGPAISVAKQDIDAFSANVSVQADRIILTDFGVLIPTLRLSMVKEFDDEDERAAITLLNDASTAQTGDRVDTSTFNVEFGVSGQFSHGWSGFITYREFAGHDYLKIESISIGARLEF